MSVFFMHLQVSPYIIRAMLFALVSLLIILFFISLGIGPFGWSLSLDSLISNAIFSYRFQRTLLALIAGSSLAASGVSLQAIFQNPLADPHLFGISGGAAVGAALVTAFCTESMLLPSVGATIGGILAFSLMFFYWGSRSHTPLANCLLIGIIVNSLAAALITLLKTWLPPAKTRSLLFWLVGNITAVDRFHLCLIIFIWILGMGLLWHIRSQLELLSFGVDESRLLGIDAKKIIQIALLANCLLIGNVVVFAGMIGFIGLVIPNMIRIYFLDMRLALPFSIIFGALALVFFDLLSRLSFMLIASEIPVGALSAILLSPLFFLLLMRTRHE